MKAIVAPVLRTLNQWDPSVGVESNFFWMAFFLFLDKTLTAEYSMRAPNTKMRQATIHASRALMYDTFGSRAAVPDAMVVMVSTVSRPSEILAGTASISIQKETQDNITIRVLGT